MLSSFGAGVSSLGVIWFLFIIWERLNAERLFLWANSSDLSGE
mgnify:CR=1 FL=1